ncbi:exodeoxyribonuclease I [Hydrogenophaga defluvii]|uniref:Exodeoxyribonuclease I n=1 Tax=Hydrogenophaga defluvii TaxID=249410 RepID=A0ABW2SDI3_9BURK
MTHTFFWHDYETFGTNARADRPAQFAGIRTDAELNEIGEPLMVYCRPAPDYLPDPESCLITGITPQLCLQQGVPENVFAAHIHSALAEPGTIGVGYNTIRFDDEFTRFLFWRNLIDPYGREWQNGCGRWDLLDVVRLTYALRPEGIQWPTKADGRPSFKLEDLARANGLVHEQAHDALSDVRATIALARLIRQHQPRLFDFALGLHKKDRVAAELGLPATADTARPFLHVSGMFPPERGCLAVMWPLASHPVNKNEVIAWDLAADPSELAQLDADTLRLRMFTRVADLPEGVTRLPVKTVHLNKSPMVVGNLKTLRPEMAERWGVDLAQAMRYAATARDLPDMSAIWAQVFRRTPDATPVDPERDLYGGFVGQGDRRRLDVLRQLSPQELALDRTGFDDERLGELVFRYRARLWPETLNEVETERWQTLCSRRLLHGDGGALTLERLAQRIDELAEAASERGDDRAEHILGQLYDYADAIAP